MKYKYFTKNDPKKEAVGIVSANNPLNAQKLASKVKKMDLNSFNKIFTVEEL